MKIEKALDLEIKTKSNAFVILFVQCCCLLDLLNALLKTPGGDCSHRTYFLTLSTADTLRIVGILHRVYIHLTRPGTDAAMGDLCSSTRYLNTEIRLNTE